MPRTRSARRRKKKSTRATKSNQKVQHKASGTKTEYHEKTSESETDTSPFKGYCSPLWSEEDFRPLALFVQPTENETEDKTCEFDKLLDPALRSHFPNKNIRTYSNKRKMQQEIDLLEFQDCKNRDNIIQWLNDNRNIFDKLTQTQREPVSQPGEEIPLTLDMPSVSQVNKVILNRSHNKTVRKTRRSPYKLRARSLDIHVTKNGRKGRNERHSLAGDTPSMENYHIEEVVTDDEAPVPAEEAKLIVNLMEDECLSALEKEVLQNNRKEDRSGNGWERIKDMNKTLNCTKKQPKKLNITLQTGENKKAEILGAPRKSYDLNQLENYFIDKMEKLLDNDVNDYAVSSTQHEMNCLQSVVIAGRNFVDKLKKIVEAKQKLNFTDLKPVVNEIKNICKILDIDTNTMSEVSVQTTSPKKYSKKIQTLRNRTSISVQTENVHKCHSCANNNNVIDNNKIEQLDKIVQTDIAKISVETQTEILNKEIMKHTSGTVTPSDIFSLSQLEKLISEQNNQAEKTSSCSLNQTLYDIQFDTENIYQESKSEKESVKVEINTNVNVPDSIESVLMCSVSTNTESKGVKRVLSKSPINDCEEYRQKRPCNKFINEDLSVDFDSGAVEEDKPRKDILVNLISDDSDYEQINNILKRYDKDLSGGTSVASSTKINKTQEDIEELEDKIRNATKPPRPVIDRPLSNDSDVIFVEAEKTLCKIEKDLDYFQPYSSGAEEENSLKRVRKNLFNSEECSKKFSESLFDNESVVSGRSGDVTITRKNVDVIMKDVINADSDGDNDKEVQEIMTNKTPKKITILQNVVVKGAHTNRDEVMEDFILSGVDVVESTPQKQISSFSQQRSESLLDITLPPPLEFQDVEMTSVEKENRKHEPKTSAQIKFTPPRRPLADVNKVTSTPVTQKDQSERISLSPISMEVSNRMMGPIEIAQKSKYSPLTIVKSQKTVKLTATPRQKSILNYVTSSQESLPSTSGGGGGKPCISCSRLGRDQVMAIAALTNKKLATYSASFSSKVTHLIVSVNNRNRISNHTIKSVSAIAAGIWVLSFKWVEECLAKNALVPEEPYEVLDVTGIPGPKKSRLTRSTNLLLKGYKIHLSPPFLSTSLKDIENIVRMLGGKVAPSPEHLLDKGDYICLIIAEGTTTQDCDVEKFDTWLEALRVVTVDLEWLSKSVGQYQLQSLIPYTLSSDDLIDTLGYPPELTKVPASFVRSTTSST